MRHLRYCSILVICGLAATAGGQEIEPVTVKVNLDTQRFLGGESTLARNKYFNIHSNYSGGVLEPEDVILLTEELNVGFGRFFNSPFNYFNGEPPYPTTEMTKALAPDKINRDKNDPLYPFRTTRRVVTEHPRKAFRMDDDPKEAARWAADYFEFLFEDDYRPEFYEPMNEPFVHTGDFGDDHEEVRRRMTLLFKEIGREFDERGLPVKVIGYASAWPSMELWDFGHWNRRMKMFMDEAGPHMDAISVHLYDGTNVTGQDNRRSGSNADAILDLIETYSFIKWGEIKPHALTEYGDIPKGFPPDHYDDARGSAELNTINHMLFGFIDRQDRILISIPFLTTKSPWYYMQPENNFLPYGPDLWRPDPDKIEDGQVKGFLPTMKFRFYELWQDVQGDRAVAYSDDPDIRAHAFVDGQDAFICLNNLEDINRTVELDVAGPMGDLSSVVIKRLNVPPKQPAEYTVDNVANPPAGLILRPHETVVLRYRFANPLEWSRRADRTTVYSKTHLQPIKAETPIKFGVDGVPTGEGRASLRMSLGRKHDVSKQPVVSVNGHEVVVPDDWPGYDQANRDDFFGAITIPVPVSYLEEETEVTLTFPDSGGKVSSVILDVELESDL